MGEKLSIAENKEKSNQKLEDVLNFFNPDSIIVSEPENDILNAKKSYEEQVEEGRLEAEVAVQNLSKEKSEQLVARGKTKNFLQATFFVITMILFILFAIAPYILVYLFREDISDSILITVVLASLVELVSAMLVLPKLIAEYLFDKEEDKNTLEFIKLARDSVEKKIE